MATPSLGDRSSFPDLDASAYLNHAAISPPSTRVRAACRQVLDDYACRGAGAWLDYRDQRERLRGKLAGLLGAAVDDVALMASTSAAVSAAALCFPWRPGDRVVAFAGEFPTNVTPWQQATAAFGGDVVFQPVETFEQDEERALADLAAAVDDGARLVAVSAVQFQTGFRMPLREIADVCHARGAQVFVDAMQCVGVVPFDVAALDVDYVAVGSHKWLMGPEGCGLLWIRPERRRELEPRVAGWLSHDDGATFLFEGSGHLRYDRPIRDRADFLEIGAMNTVGFAGLEAAVDDLITLGIEPIHAHVDALNDRLEQRLVELGFTSKRSPRPERRSGILSLLPPTEAPADLATLWEALGAHGIACSMPDGHLRFAPHWPNDTGQIDHVAATVAALLSTPGHST